MQAQPQTTATHPSILMHSGLHFSFTDASNSVVMIEDIAHALSHICRFTGHTNAFYSVAQHSVLASQLVPASDALAALLHDAAEAVIGDVSHPLKQLLPDYRRIEAEVEANLFSNLGIPLPLPASVKHADLRMLATERRDLMPHHDAQWPILHNVQPMERVIQPWPPALAKAIFLQRYYDLRVKEAS